MTIERERISFGSGDGGLTSYPIVGVLVEKLPDEVRYAVDYVMETGGEYRLRVVYEPATRQVRLAGRRQVVWTKET